VRRIREEGLEYHNFILREGDYVICVYHGGSQSHKKGNTYKIESLRFGGVDIKVEGVDLHWASVEYMLAIKDTKLNRVLYPELVPENGYMRAKK